MTIPELINIPEIDLYNILMSFINDNVTDIRPDRKNKRWIFESFPTKNTNCPEAVIEINGSTIIPNSGAQFLSQEKDVHGNVTKEMYYTLEECPVKIRVLTTKDYEVDVTENSKQRHLKDKFVNLYLQSKIKNIFIFKYTDLLKNYLFDSMNIIDKVRVTSIDRTYESNDRTWASDLTVTVTFKNLYIKEYDEGELINEYSLILNTTT